jgi:hypothetical protein
MPGANKQPLFTNTPILVTKQFDPEDSITFTSPGWSKSTLIYEDTSDYGSLITKITVTAAAGAGDTVTTKAIYLGIKDLTSGIISTYQSKVMIGIAVLASSDQVPYVVFDFGGGLVMSATTGYALYIAASRNAATTGESGDEINVVVEGGIYDT